MQIRDYSGWEQIDESELRQHLKMSETLGMKINNKSLEKLLDAGEVFKYAELTPVYMYDEETGRMAVYAEELRGKLLH